RQRQLVVWRTLLDRGQRLLRQAIVAQPVAQPFGEDCELRGLRGLAWHHVNDNRCGHARAATFAMAALRLSMLESAVEPNTCLRRRGLRRGLKGSSGRAQESHL